MVGKTYLEHGVEVVVLARWANRGGPHNVLIQRADGTKAVRPFRGLRRVTATSLGANAIGRCPVKVTRR